MPRVSKRPIGKKVGEDLKESFASLISSLQTSNEIEQFFKDFLTNEESTMLAKRLMIYLMLENKHTASDIELVLSMSRESIRFHQKAWENGGEVYKKVIAKIAKRQKTREFLKKVEKLLKPIDLALSAKTNMKARAKFASGDWD
ncbi:MAG: hypothetical protein COX78_02230 [Candidatus Levybacteria bacterium CG_4_10_14_0_2_um_filter_35_8]|nr:MAG: hypothetical protein COW87_03985 [Candidatus Levybacteria bacterium CG22_combo_CG10-13_8_21_14_all_35_11]PIY94228.1 MAG: hypothetical protein COY68_03470 [Candidatus Levybacteria bacterium CG_4_10_14_0_8_um_filter_35_23]PIZ99106.1 MAG: hypothetical protein COX78_02230 [Candidatus Levybacteria bacterium CG_4_10_14_0_2_um_filter_35_8]